MIKVGEFNDLLVKKKKDFGYYLAEELEGNREDEVLLPLGNAEGNEFEIEDKITAFVYKDSEDRNVATLKTPLAKVGDVAYLKVVDQTKIGFFIDFGLERDILVPFKELAYELTVGNSYLFYIYLDKTGRITATTYVDKYLNNTNHFNIGEEVMATVYGEQTNGTIMVAIQNLFRGVILKKENFFDLRAGAILDVRVKRYYEDGKMEVTPRKNRLEEKSDLENAILLYLKINNGLMEFNDKSSPEEIKNTFKCSKNAFKRALGGLMKKEIISQTSEGTKLIEENSNTVSKLNHKEKENSNNKVKQDKNLKKVTRKNNINKKNLQQKDSIRKHKKDDNKDGFYTKFFNK